MDAKPKRNAMSRLWHEYIQEDWLTKIKMDAFKNTEKHACEFLLNVSLSYKQKMRSSPIKRALIIEQTFHAQRGLEVK